MADISETLRFWYRIYYIKIFRILRRIQMINNIQGFTVFYFKNFLNEIMHVAWNNLYLQPLYDRMLNSFPSKQLSRPIYLAHIFSDDAFPLCWKFINSEENSFWRFVSNKLWLYSVSKSFVFFCCVFFDFKNKINHRLSSNPQIIENKRFKNYNFTKYYYSQNFTRKYWTVKAQFCWK